MLLIHVLFLCLTACSSPDTPTPLPVLSTVTDTAPVPTATATPPPTLSRALQTTFEPQQIVMAVPLVTLRVSQQPTDLPVTPTPLPTQTLPPDILGNVPAMEARLRRVPVLYQMTTDAVRAIYANGQQRGNRSNVFTVIGDSNSTNGDFLYPIGLNQNQANICEYGGYAALQDTVVYFSAPINSVSQSSFMHDSQTADRGFNSGSVFDPIWTTGSLCQAGESPLMCEYRTVQPSTAVIMLGGIDVNSLDTETYANNMREIMDTSIAQGIIPIVTTFVVLPGRDVYQKSLEFNMRLLDLAEERQTPVINLWAAAESLPDMGIGPDRTHLKASVGNFCNFTGAELEYGGTLRNLLTLQALDEIRRGVFS